MSSNTHPDAIMRVCLDNQDTALVVVTDVTGGTMRAPGAMMAVSGDGTAKGYVSNGCVDADIAAQAVAALGDGQLRHLVYGAGSPFRDITLPCGGRIDVTIWPRPDVTIIRGWWEALTARRSVNITLPERDVSLTLLPRLRLRIAGRGAAMDDLAQLAQSVGYDIILQSPDVRPDAVHLLDPTVCPDVTDDVWTAVVLLFHDHDWEAALLVQALAGEAFFVGAMGSHTTHLNRCVNLRNAGVSDADIARIHGPIGLLPAMRNTQTLAVSILAEIIQTAQAKGRL